MIWRKAEEVLLNVFVLGKMSVSSHYKVGVFPQDN